MVYRYLWRVSSRSLRSVIRVVGVCTCIGFLCLWFTIISSLSQSRRAQEASNSSSLQKRLLWPKLFANMKVQHEPSDQNVSKYDSAQSQEHNAAAFESHDEKALNQGRSFKNDSKVDKFRDSNQGNEWERIGRFQFKTLAPQLKMFAKNSKPFQATGRKIITIPETDPSFKANICQKKKVPFLLCLVPSLPQDVLRRDAIRKSWGSATETGSWAGKPLRHKVALMFIFAFENYQPHQLQEIGKESKMYGDIIAGKLSDSYFNLTMKLLMGMQWTVANCPGIKFFAKVDQDTFVNLGLLMEMLDALLTAGKSSFILGYQHPSPRPPVMRQGRWKVSSEVYSLPQFPRYLYGHSYVISGNLLQPMLRRSRRLPYFPPEDAFFTGILALSLNVTRLHSERFATAQRTMYMCDLFSERFLAVSPITPRTHIKIWNMFNSASCDPSEVIKNSSRPKASDS